MPNWCENKLVLKDATPEQIKRFEKKYFRIEKSVGCPPKRVLSFNKVTRMPKSQAENWHPWRMANWGTKWDIAADSFESDGEGTYYFYTAWGPAEVAYEKLITDNPHLNMEFHYIEFGMAFFGGICSHPTVGSMQWYNEDDQELLHKTAIEVFGWDASNFDDDEGEPHCA